MAGVPAGRPGFSGSADELHNQTGFDFDSADGDDGGLIMGGNASQPSISPMLQQQPPSPTPSPFRGIETPIVTRPPPQRHQRLLAGSVDMPRVSSVPNNIQQGATRLPIMNRNSPFLSRQNSGVRGNQSLDYVDGSIATTMAMGDESSVGGNDVIMPTLDGAQNAFKRDEKFLRSVLDSIKKEQRRGSFGHRFDKSDGTIFNVFSSDRRLVMYQGLAQFLQQDFDLLFKDFFWIDVCNPKQEDMTLMEKTFGIHPLTSEDILAEYTREKVESYDTYVFTVAEGRTKEAGGEEGWTNIHIAVFNDFVLTFHRLPCLCLENVVAEMAHPATVLRSDWVLYLVLDEVVDELEPIVSACETEIGAIDEFIFYLGQKDQSDVLRRIAVARKKLAKLTRKLKPKRDILLYLTGHGKSVPKQLAKTTFLYMRDILDAISEMVVKLDSSREVINSTQSNYLAQISMELGIASNRGNDALNKLTVASTIFLPLNLIAGLFGMNVQVPFSDVENLWPFIGICLLMLAISLLLTVWAKKAKML